MSFPNGVASWDRYARTEQYQSYVRNPRNVEKETGKYFPRLTSFKRWFGQDSNIRIEFSAPKLLYMNNLDELEDKDFPQVIGVLRDRLKTMGIDIEKAVLEDAPVSSVHFSRNIELVGGYTASYLIAEMNKVNLSKNLDFARTRFLNDGQSLYAHNSSHELVIYDKVADLKSANKRAIDRDQPLYQRHLPAVLSTTSDRTEIIRFEVRLIKKRKLESVLEGLGYAKGATFKKVFSSVLSQKIIISYWKEIILTGSFGIFAPSLSIKDMLKNLFLSDEGLKPKPAIYLLGLFMLSKDEGGMRQLRSIVSKRMGERTWYRMTKDVDIAGQMIVKGRVSDWVLHIDKSLKAYKPYRLKVIPSPEEIRKV